jgi:DNA-binding MarR family transcriptional regulator
VSELLGDGLAVTLHQLVYRLDAYAEQLLREHHGVSYSNFHFLAVATTTERPDVTTLAECLGVSKAAVSKRLDALVRGGWITLGSDPANARRVIIELTPQALTLVAEGTVMLEREVAQVLSGLPPGEAQQLNQRLRALVDRFPDPAQ